MYRANAIRLLFVNAPILDILRFNADRGCVKKKIAPGMRTARSPILVFHKPIDLHDVRHRCLDASTFGLSFLLARLSSGYLRNSRDT